MVNTLQTVKFSMRANLTSGSISSFTALFWGNLFVQSSDATNNNVNERFNQGWIISDIYSTIPYSRPYYKGETIVSSVLSSALPSFMYGSRAMDAEISKVYFTEFTGHPLTSSTSMGLSVLGEAYGNFGVFGGMLFMFFWGWGITRLLKWLNKQSKTRNLLWFFLIPMICHDLYKAELSFFKVFNWTFKGFIFAWILIFIIDIYYSSISTKSSKS